MTTTERPTSPFLREPSYDAATIDFLMTTVSAEVAGKVVKHPLTDDQRGVLTTLVEYGHGDFCWQNTSTTERLLDALVKKGLATKITITDRYGRVRPQYKPLSEMRAAHLDRKQAQERARQEEQARQQAERDAQRAAAEEALEADRSVLWVALLFAKDQGAITDAEYRTAYNRVGALRTGWFA